MADLILHLISELFELLFGEPQSLPQDWRVLAQSLDERRRARLVADYIAGMTDPYAEAEYARLFDGKPALG